MVSPLSQTTSVGVPFHEQIYTSAEKLLESTTGHLGIVASTRDFPRELAPAFEPLRSYTILPHLPIDQPALHPSRLVVGPGTAQGQWYCVTQVSFAGADHTGRTTPLAHHAAISQIELSEQGVPPATALRQIVAGMSRRWREAPRWIEPPRKVSRVAAASNKACSDERLLSACDIIVSFRESRRPAVFAVDHRDPTAAFNLIARILELLPESVQRSITCASHVVERNEVPRDCALIVTYQDSPYWEHLQHRAQDARPWMCDWAAESPRAPEPLGPYATAISEAFSPDASASSYHVAKLWDALGFDAEQAAIFPAVVSVARQLAAANSLADTAALSSELEELQRARPSKTITSRLDEHGVQCIERAVRDKAADRWAMLCRVAFDAAWPAAAQAAALRLLVENGDRSVPKLLEQRPTAELSQRAIHTVLAKLTSECPSLVARVVDHAARKPSLQSAQWAATMLSLAAGSREQLLQWSKPLLNANDQLRQATLPVLHNRLSVSSPSPAELAELWRISNSGEFAGTPVANTLVQPLIHARLAHTADDAMWRAYSSLWLEAQAASGRLPEAIVQLASQYRSRITPEVVHQWRTIGQALGVAPSIDIVLAKSQLQLQSTQAARVAESYVEAQPPANNQRIGSRFRSSVRRPTSVQGGWRAVGPVTSNVALSAVTLLLVILLVTLVVSDGNYAEHWLLLAISGFATAIVIAWVVYEYVIRAAALTPAKRASLKRVRFCTLAFLAILPLLLSGLMGIIFGSAITSRSAELIEKARNCLSWEQKE